MPSAKFSTKCEMNKFVIVRFLMMIIIILILIDTSKFRFSPENETKFEDLFMAEDGIRPLLS